MFTTRIHAGRGPYGICKVRSNGWLQGYTCTRPLQGPFPHTPGWYSTPYSDTRPGTWFYTWCHSDWRIDRNYTETRCKVSYTVWRTGSTYNTDTVGRLRKHAKSSLLPVVSSGMLVLAVSAVVLVPRQWRRQQTIELLWSTFPRIPLVILHAVSSRLYFGCRYKYKWVALYAHLIVTLSCQNTGPAGFPSFR